MVSCVLSESRSLGASEEVAVVVVNLGILRRRPSPDLGLHHHYIVANSVMMNNVINIKRLQLPI